MGVCRVRGLGYRIDCFKNSGKNIEATIGLGGCSSYTKVFREMKKNIAYTLN